jgi:hypothetical protein
MSHRILSGQAVFCFTTLDPTVQTTVSTSGQNVDIASPILRLDEEWFQGDAVLRCNATHTLHTIRLVGWPARQPPPIHDCCRESTRSEDAYRGDEPCFYDIQLDYDEAMDLPVATELSNILRPSSGDAVRLTSDIGLVTCHLPVVRPTSSDNGTWTAFEFDTSAVYVDASALKIASKFFPTLVKDTQLRICVGQLTLNYTQHDDEHIV